MIETRERWQNFPIFDKGDISTRDTNLRTGEFTIESLAKKIGISEATLYGWVRKDAEFIEGLKMIKRSTRR